MSFPIFRLGLSNNGVRRIRALLADVSWLLEEREETRNPTDESTKTKSKLSRIRCRVIDILNILNMPRELEEMNDDMKLVNLILAKINRKREEKKLADWEKMLALRNKRK